MRAVIIDANLLVLLIVGLTSTAYIEKHKRLAKYSAKSFYQLLSILDTFPDLIVLPHVLAETSTLLAKINDPIKTEIFGKFRMFIEDQTELAVPSVTAARQPEFARLGLTDAIILAASLNHVKQKPHILTDDLHLAIAADRRGLPSLNFNYGLDES